MASSESRPIVSFLGPIASYSHQAVCQVFSESTWELRPASTINDVFDQVQGGEVTAGVVPFENSTNGSVVFTLDNLADRNGRYKDISVHGEIFVDVHHCLLGHRHTILSLEGDGSGSRTPTALDPSPARPKSTPLTSLKHITRIYSHPQAFGQCNDFISTYLKGVEILDVSSTSRAAEIVSQDTTGTWAAISSELATNLLDGLDMLAKNIEDRDDNTTRFLIIGRNQASPPPSDWNLSNQSNERVGKTMISMTVPHASPGALAEVLSCFKDFDLNLTSINSRPSLLKPFQYVFFIEFEGYKYDDPAGRVRGALEKIDRVAESWRLLGSWERYL